MTAPAGDPATPAPQGAPTPGTVAAAPEPTYTAPSSQADLDRIVEGRLARERSRYGGTPDEVKAWRTEFDALKAEHGTAADKVAAQAAEKAKADTLAEIQPALVQARLEAAAARAGVDEAALTKALKFTDAAKFLTPDGQLDPDAVKEFVGAIGTATPVTPAATGPRGPIVPGHNPGGPAPSKPGDGGRAAAERRFGKTVA